MSCPGPPHGQPCDLGVWGLGVMGRSLALNFADHGFRVAVFNRTAEKTRKLLVEGAGRELCPAFSPKELVASLKPPRVVLLLVSAGTPVEECLTELVPLLAPGDLVMDGGNSHFADSDRRARTLAEKGLHFLGLGISGGELGARYGPSLMPGGSREGYERVAPLLEAVAARAEGEPCVAYLGPGGAGHFVKMVHNGIEYALEELLAEAYDLLHRGLGLEHEALAEVFRRYQEGPLQSYLVEISAAILKRRDEESGRPLLALIKDVAGQKGTGVWTSQTAAALGVPIPTIDAAVALRHLSALKEERESAARFFPGPGPFFPPPGHLKGFIGKLEEALLAAFYLAFAQGFALLQEGSRHFRYDFAPGLVAGLWRAGSIIRGALLQDIKAAYESQPNLPNLLLHPRIGGKVRNRQARLREVVKAAVDWGLPAAALMASLAYFDAYRSRRLPANLIQAQRDCFGSHTYERLDRPGVFHTDWLAG